MAAFIIRRAAIAGKEISSTLRQSCRLLSTKSPVQVNKNVSVESKTSSSSLAAFERSLSERGFLRAQKPYNPPEDVLSRLEALFKSILPSNQEHSLDNLELKFDLLNACFKEFGHGVPNSMLTAINTLDELREFYCTPVRTSTPLEAMQQMELPPNLHVQQEYVRFHPETDTMFGGVSAFPKSSTIVTGLKYKKKYPGYKAKVSWP